MAFLWVKESQEKELKDGVSSRIMCADCTDQDKIDRGCKGGVNWDIGKYNYDGCPENLITEEVLNCFNVWTDWKLFGLPLPGHWTDQPVWIIDSIKTLDEVSRI